MSKMGLNAILGIAMLVASGCGGGGKTPAGGGSVATAEGGAATTVPRAPLAPSEIKARQEASLVLLRGYVADPSTIPRLSTPDGKARFEAIVGERVWLDDVDFMRDAEAAMAVLPALKALSYALVKLDARDESVLLALYMDEVLRALLASGHAMMVGREDDPTQGPRRDGLLRMSIGAAQGLASLLVGVGGASPAFARQIEARLTDPATYRDLSGPSLQLLLATVDARIARAPAGGARDGLTKVREVVAAVHAERPAASPRTPVYEAMPPGEQIEPQPVVSRGGGFTIVAGPGALIWRGPWPAEEGSTGPIVHQLQWINDGRTLEVVCFDTPIMAAMLKQLESVGMVMSAGPAPGTWGTLKVNDRTGRVRLTTIGKRDCMAAFDLPATDPSTDEADAILASLAPATP